MPRSVLIADDDAVVVDVVRRYLERDGFDVVTACSGTEALHVLRSVPIAVAVLDVMMPAPDGLAVCRDLRTGGRPDPPVILLTALGEEEDRIRGLEVGADDYVTKPFSPRELALRVAAVLRRAGPRAAAEPIVRDGLRADRESGTVDLGGSTVSLTAREFDLLDHFLRNPGTVYSRDELLAVVWGWTFGDQSTVTVHVKRLRDKLGRAHRIETVWGRGYRWRETTPTTEGSA